MLRLQQDVSQLDTLLPPRCCHDRRNREGHPLVASGRTCQQPASCCRAGAPTGQLPWCGVARPAYGRRCRDMEGLRHGDELLAGLQSVPGELYDAARIDGANSAQVLRFVTLPLLLPVALTIVALTLVWSLNVFELVQVMISGEPGNATDVIAMYIVYFVEGVVGAVKS